MVVARRRLQRQKERDEIREMIGDLPGFEPFPGLTD